jgi:hypothetical protein
MSRLKMPHTSSPPLSIDKIRRKWSWVSGTARGTEDSREQYQKDLKNAFSEIDGLMAGFTYLDEMGASQHVTDSPSSPVAIDDPPLTEAKPTLSTDQYPMDIDIDLSEEEDQGAVPPYSASSSDSQRQPMAAQWDAIRDLRKETEYHHQRFQRMATLANDPILSQLRESYKDSKSIRTTGILIFRDVLDGFQPSKLRDIFAFASLSYAVSQLLFKSGRIDKMEILGGLKAWRDSIADASEREAFNKLAHNLWPEAKNHLHFIPIPQMTPRSDTCWPRPPSNYQDTTSATMNRPYDSFPGPPLGHGPVTSDMSVPNLVFEELDGINQTSFGFAEHLIDLTKFTQEVWEFSRLNDLSSVETNRQTTTSDIPATFSVDAEQSHSQHFGWHQQPAEYPSLLGDNAPGGAEHVSPESDAEKIRLQDTLVFVVVVTFIFEIKDLLNILSGRGLVSKPDKLYKNQEQQQKRFYKSAKEDFFEPRACSRPIPYRTYTALLSVAKIFTREAYLKTISEVKHYLVTVAVVRKYHHQARSTS